MSFKKHVLACSEFISKVLEITQVSHAMHPVYYSYLTGSEGDSIVVLHSIFILPIVQPLPADTDCHRSQIVIHPEIVLMLWRSSKKDQN